MGIFNFFKKTDAERFAEYVKAIQDGDHVSIANMKYTNVICSKCSRKYIFESTVEQGSDGVRSYYRWSCPFCGNYYIVGI